MKKAILSISLGVLVLGCSLFGFTNIVKHRAKNVDYSSWMSQLPDNTPITSVNMPGTHDTMALYSVGDLAGQCQSLKLEDQLKIGVRFLDIRLQLVNNELKAVHGFIDQRESFKDIVNTVDKFLKAHNSEYIIMSIKEEADAKKSTISFDDAVKKCRKSNWSKRQSLATGETVADYRGQVIIMSRYAGATIGIPAYEGWIDNATFNLPNGIHVQDQYKLKSCQEKIDAIDDCFNRQDEYMKINFLSGYIDGGFPPSYAPSVANTVNKWIKENIKSYLFRGIVLFDFVTSDLMKGWFEI